MVTPGKSQQAVLSGLRDREALHCSAGSRWDLSHVPMPRTAPDTENCVLTVEGTWGLSPELAWGGSPWLLLHCGVFVWIERRVHDSGHLGGTLVAWRACHLLWGEQGAGAFPAHLALVAQRPGVQ